MDRMRRIAGIGGKAKVPTALQMDKDESVVFFRELYKREKDKDVNLLEPMYSVEFEAIQGGHACKVPPAKRDFLIPVDDKHDYDWLMTPPATPLFPSLEIEAHSSQKVFQRELPIPRQAKPPTSRLLAKPEATKTSARSATPTSKPSSRKNTIKGVPAIPKEKKQPYTADQRPSHKVPVNGHHQKAAAAATIPGTRIGGPPKKHSERCCAAQASGTSAINAVTDQETPFKAPKNLITTTARSIFRRHTPSAENARTKDPGSLVDVKKGNGKARSQWCPPVPVRGMTELQLQDRREALPPRGKSDREWEWRRFRH
ncbi:hypothetical protein HU200_062020 [Digitaria exilis]|uniref:Uncharacterized protein n=1 Tax=Digitaria exilis TaxID=1010633 RepID=A0A835A707_9POAL|nr:hypothetical protein HU200_062020 [Digitaria exilis]